MKRKQVLKWGLVAILLLPLWMFLAWLLSPKRVLVAAVVDKTVLSPNGQEHTSLTWLLNNSRFSKTSSKGYEIAKDYFGFFPGKDEKFKLKGLERFSADQLDRLTSDADLVYFTDTYGIYKNEWYQHRHDTERSGIIYGGMSEQDISLLRNMKQKHKLIISEFNTIGSPTQPAIRDQFEKLFGLHWTGWTARYFDLLDTMKNKELPRWLINNYKQGHKGKWPFSKAGIAFVNDAGKVVILEEDRDLDDPMTYIVRKEYGKESLDIPKKIQYPFWFDVMVPNLKVNNIAATFYFKANEHGIEQLKENGIPGRIPAVLAHKGSDYHFYYFSGDFCDNPVPIFSSYFKGIGAFSGLFYRSDDPTDRAGFFWEFYRPMMRRILEERFKEVGR